MDCPEYEITFSHATEYERKLATAWALVSTSDIDYSQLWVLPDLEAKLFYMLTEKIGLVDGVLSRLTFPFKTVWVASEELPEEWDELWNEGNK